MSSRFYFVVLLALSVALSGGCNSERTESNALTVVSYGGGAYQESHIDAFFKPFSDITGLQIEPVTWGAEYGKLKAMVDSNNVPWDVVEVTDAQFKRGKRENLFHPLEALATDGEFLPGTTDQYGVGNVYWGTVLAYLPDVYTEKQPHSWKDFWDVKSFPGRRGLRDDPRANLEFALLADGVSKDNLYPLDVERAFRKLDEVKQHIRVWWNEGTQPMQLLQARSVDLTSAWNGRIFALAKEGMKMGYSWEGAALELDWWVIPRGSKNVSTGSRFIAFASTPERMARQAKFIGYGPVNKMALEFLRDEVQRQLPTYPANLEKSFIVNSDWWSEHEAEMMRRWVEWKSR